MLIITLASISGGCDASLAMFDKKTNLKVTLHYDSTIRNSIDGEWPSLILSFSDGQTFRHRPIVFAFEDRKQIASLIVETYERLAAAATIINGEIITAANLWEETDVFMTDAASKNLKNLLKDLYARIASHITFFVRATQWRGLTSQTYQCSLRKLEKVSN